MGEPQFIPRFRTDVYPFIYPEKFKGSLQDKVAIVTGSAGAIGQALAESFAVAGAKLVLTYNRTPPPPALKDRCLKFGASSVDFVKCNVTELEGCESLVKTAIDTHGRVDILVNNAGASVFGPMYAQDPRDFIRDVAVNFHAPYYLMRLLIPKFRDQKSGCVLNIASRAGTVNIPYSTSYCSSKAALINLTSCTQTEMDAEELNDVHLYSLHPGGIKSALTLNKYTEEAINNLPPRFRSVFKNQLDVYNDSPYLNGMVCVALATGVGKQSLRGRYIDVGQDLEDVLAQADALKADKNLNTLHTTFLGGLNNAGAPPGGYHAAEHPFEFPGF